MKRISSGGFWLAIAVISLSAWRVFAQGSQRPIVPAGADAAQSGAQSSTGAPHRTRLILKDGSYQVVMSYTVSGNIVNYLSAERGGMEQIPADLVDWDKTKKWERAHTDGSSDAGQAQGDAAAPAIDPELEKEEADRRALTPDVAPDLKLPELGSVLALDYYQGTPELVPLVQSDGELNRETSHNVLKLTLNPRAASHAIVELKGVESAVQMHVAQPEIYLRVGDDSGANRGGQVFTVDTHGAGADKRGAVTNETSSGGSQYSGYVMVRADVRTDVRVLASFNIGAVGDARRPQQDVVETKQETLPGGHWMKITPVRPLDFGEYALMEIVSDNAVNSAVWDFGVHPVAPENRDVIKPEPKKPIELERRRPN